MKRGTAALRQTALFILFHFYALIALGAGPVILYPGSFDPFHKTHEQEVEMVLKEFPSAQVYILPIDQAQYTPRVPGSDIRYPKFLDYVSRLTWIDEVFADHDAVHVSGELEFLDSSVLEELIAAVNNLNATHILVGIDVVEKWAAQGILRPIQEHVTLIVTGDPLYPESLEDFKTWPHEEVDREKIHLMEGVEHGIRSVEVQRNIVDSRNLESVLPEAIVSGIESGAIDIDTILSNYAKRVTQYLRMSFMAEAWPALSETLHIWGGGDLVALFESDSQLLMFLSLFNITGSGRWLGQLDSYLKQKIEFDDLPVSTQLRMLSTLTAAFQRPEVEAWYTRQSHFMGMLERIFVRMSGTLPKVREQDGLRQRLGHKAFQFFMGPTGRLIQKALAPLFKLRLPDQDMFEENYLEAATTETLTLYRGVRNVEGLEEREKVWLRDGFLSKAALKLYLAGAPIDMALQESERLLRELGVQNALINHILGQWDDHTPFISTTLDKSIAREFAGVGGRVYTLRIPAQRALFANDLYFWQNTIWAELGNPSSKQLEVLIPHYIAPENIIDIEVVETAPASNVMASSFAPAARVYSQFLRQYAMVNIQNLRARRPVPYTLPPAGPSCSALLLQEYNPEPVEERPN